MAGLARRGMAGRGEAWQARQGVVWKALASFGEAWQAWQD